ncbi:MAG: hypothetical protein KKE86_09775 [Planctomycetes bacterium]|nr:hypothetical protein [Planctomycetota bacterium]MBU4399608.1 hypothetical protein [Planctomycetota bacterium]MCG2682735.1 ATP-binding protein [Planctomycetales bacterium]
MLEKASIYWHRWTTVAALLLAWGVLAAWQWQEYKAECDTARDALRRQAESVVNALVGGVRSHRRLGRFVEEQLQAALDELAKSQDVLAVAVISTDNRLSLTAGKADLLDLASPIEPGRYWDKAGFLYAAGFQVMPNMPGPRMGPGPGMRPNPGARPQLGRDPNEPLHDEAGPDRGMGPGRRAGRRRDGPDWPPPQDMGKPPLSGRFLAVLLLDRSRTDRLIQHYAWLRILVVVAGGVVIFSVVLAWRATVRLAETHGRAQLLEIETRHLHDLSQAATGLAHETRNPLGLIRGWTQRWMQAMPADGPQRRQAQAVIEECDRVTARINQFLAFVRPCKPRLAPVRPAEVVAELAALVEPDLDAKRLELVAATSTPERTIRADREMLRQALFNLIQNAVEFSPEGNVIDVSCGVGQDGPARIEVADRGPGVPAEAVDLLFTPYHTTRADGTGLGLAIVRRIATAHGWQSGYAPRPGGGAVFWIGEKRGRN